MTKRADTYDRPLQISTKPRGLNLALKKIKNIFLFNSPVALFDRLTATLPQTENLVRLTMETCFKWKIKKEERDRTRKMRWRPTEKEIQR